MNILVHTLWFSKYKGSEFSVAYNYVLEMSKKHHLYVIVESCSYELNDLSEFDGGGLQNVEYIFVPFSGKLNLLRFLTKLCGNHYYTYVIFNEWERRLYKQIRNSDLIDKIDCVHFLGPVGWHLIGWLYKLGKPCIWGPVGGFTNCKKEFYSHYVMSDGRKIALKNLLNSFSALTSRHVRYAMKSYNLVIANTTDTERFIRKHYKAQHLVYFPENSMRIAEIDIKDVVKISQKYKFLENEKIECIWCGSLFDGKMPGMLLDIVARLKHKEKIHINVVGGGYLEKYLKERIKNEGLSAYVSLCGMLPREQVRTCFEKAHIHLLTSAYEANTTVMFEAMEECVPSIVFDHFGMADLVKDGKTGRKIVVSKYKKMCVDFATCLDEIAENPSFLKEWALNLREDSKKYTAEKRTEFFEKCYSIAIKNHQSN